MNSKPLILVTNDDSIFAKGIESLVEVAKSYGDVLVIAPDRPQSGMGHAISVNDPLRLSPYSKFGDVKAYSCNGTPVDCVKLAIYGVLHKKPDLLLSGVNHGANHSINVLYSGTMSAAVEGALEQIPSIGFSLLDYDAEADFEASKLVIKTLIENTLNNELTPGVCLNVNIPALPHDQIRGIRVCRQGSAHWQDKFDERKDTFGRPYFWLAGDFKDLDNGEDTDTWALNNNFVSVVPVQYDMTAHHEIALLNNWDL